MTDLERVARAAARRYFNWSSEVKDLGFEAYWISTGPAWLHAIAGAAGELMDPSERMLEAGAADFVYLEDTYESSKTVWQAMLQSILTEGS